MNASIFRIAAICGNTYREAIRMRLFLLLSVTGVLSLAGGLYFQEFDLGSSELRFIADFGFGAMTLLGSIVTVVATVQLIFGEIEHRTILPVLSKPVSRGEFLLGKLLGAWLTICSFIGILAFALLAALAIRESQLSATFGDSLIGADSVNYMGVFSFSVLQCLRLMILASITAFFSSYASSSMFAVFMGGLVWVVGQLRGAFAAEWGDGIGQSIVRTITLLVPDLRVYDLGEAAFGNAGLDFGSVCGLAAYAVAYATLYGGLAAMVLKKREF